MGSTPYIPVPLSERDPWEEAERLGHSEYGLWLQHGEEMGDAPKCLLCGERLQPHQEVAEVVERDGTSGVAHAQCYLDKQAEGVVLA